jgi:hypothetical protein
MQGRRGARPGRQALPDVVRYKTNTCGDNFEKQHRHARFINLPIKKDHQKRFTPDKGKFRF